MTRSNTSLSSGIRAPDITSDHTQGIGAWSTDDIATLLEENASSKDACRALVELALARGGPDNITVIVAGYRVR